jgi:hypothetical protein
MSNFKVLNDLLDRVRNDYQFDQTHELYHGFLNISPSNDWTVEESETFYWFLENNEKMLDDALELRGLMISSMGPDEIVFELSEEAFDFSLTQGRTVSQEETNEKLVTISLTILIIIIIGVLASTLN